MITEKPGFSPLAEKYILSVGDDVNLLSSRHLVLQSAGYQVLSIESGVLLQHPIGSHFDLLLLCHTLQTATANRIVRWSSTVRPGQPVLWIYSANSLRDRPEGQFATCSAIPEELLRTIGSLLGAGTLLQN